MSKISSTRTRRKQEKPLCPICHVEMKRKGQKSNPYFKCPNCKGKMIGSEFHEHLTPDRLDMHLYMLRKMRKEEVKRKLIKRLKKQKYLGFKQFRFEGEVINLDDYGKDGTLIKEKEGNDQTKKTK